jgi:hypothetical protein
MFPPSKITDSQENTPNMQAGIYPPQFLGILIIAA